MGAGLQKGLNLAPELTRVGEEGAVLIEIEKIEPQDPGVARKRLPNEMRFPHPACTKEQARRLFSNNINESNRSENHIPKIYCFLGVKGRMNKRVSVRTGRHCGRYATRRKYTVTQLGWSRDTGRLRLQTELRE